MRPKHLRVPVEAIQDALATLDSEVRAAIEESVRRARAVAANQVPKDFYTDLAEALVLPNVGFRFSASACMCLVARLFTRLP